MARRIMSGNSERLDVGIAFPVLTNLTVSGYGLFETGESSGIRHSFDGGVHIIVGVNGLGKTTLLNIIYRLMLGPKDMSKEDSALGSTGHKLTNWRNEKYFRSRVRDDARNAWAEAEISFGLRRLKIRRSLRNMSVLALSIDGVDEGVATQERYEEIICELSGLSSYFDFYAILRFLVFFLEDRPELIWDRRSQSDMFRLLFYDRMAAAAAAAAYDEAQRVDSEYRNRRVPINAAKEEVEAFDAAENSGMAAEIRAARAALAAAEKNEYLGSEDIETAREAVASTRLSREKARLDLEEARRAYENEEQLFYKHVFPDLEHTAELVFLRLSAGGGCAVCGNRTAAARERLRKYAEAHRCPICESAVEEQEGIVGTAEFNRRRLERYGEQVEGLRTSVAHLENELSDCEDALRDAVASQGDTRTEVVSRRQSLSALLLQVSPDLPDAILADDREQIEHKRRYVQEGEKELKRLMGERTSAETTLIEIMSAQETRLQERLAVVKSEFYRISRRLLAEECRLREVEDENRRIGQEGRSINFPALEVMMTSGVFTGSLNSRTDATSVSESQREFIDLAFRMALIEAAKQPGSGAMLVMETPEASLDSLFVAEAGDLFRGFATDEEGGGNLFIASTNLNNEGMIPALFGARLPPNREPLLEADRDALAREAPPKPAEPAPILEPTRRVGRLINLLRLSAPNAALRAHRRFYEDKLRAALFEDVDEEDWPPLHDGHGVEAPEREGDA